LDNESVSLTQIVIGIGHAFDLANYILNGISGNYWARVYLDHMRNRLLLIPPPQGELRSIENIVQAEDNFTPEKLKDLLLFQDCVAEVVRQLVWSFNWGDKAKIFESTRQILQRNGLPHHL